SQLGSKKFSDRREAARSLLAIGAPALDALRKAARADDPEVRRQARDLIRQIEKGEESALALKATKLRLRYKDAPVSEVLADLRKKSGYSIEVEGVKDLGRRKVTLETGEVTFWEGFDQFCDKAGLVEKDLLKEKPGAGEIAPAGPDDVMARMMRERMRWQEQMRRRQMPMGGMAMGGMAPEMPAPTR